MTQRDQIAMTGTSRHIVRATGTAADTWALDGSARRTVLDGRERGVVKVVARGPTPSIPHPATYPGAYAFWDAREIGRPNSLSVSDWADEIMGYNLHQGYQPRQPVVHEKAQAPQTYLQTPPDRSGDSYLEAGEYEAFELFHQTNQWSLSITFRLDSDGYAFFCRTTGGGQPGRRFDARSDGQLHIWGAIDENGTAGHAFLQGILDDGRFHTYTVTASPAQWTLYRDGVEVDSTAPLATTGGLQYSHLIIMQGSAVCSMADLLVCTETLPAEYAHQYHQWSLGQ